MNVIVLMGDLEQIALAPCCNETHGQCKALLKCRPLFAQFAGNDAKTLLSAMSHIQDQCDAFDINFGWCAPPSCTQPC